MEKLIGNAIVGQSGGPTAAINATLAGVIRGAQESDAIGKIYGARNGIEGVLARRLIDLSSMSEDDLSLLETTPAAALGSCRKKLPADFEGANRKIFEDIVAIFDIHGLDTEIIAASIRNPLHVVDAAKAGCHIATIPYNVLIQMSKHPLTDNGIEKFLKDWETVPKK